VEVLGYVRVSTDEQGDSGNGLEAQRMAISAKAAARGWAIIGWYQDVASGKSLRRRPQLHAALDELRNKRAAGLVVAKLDRLSRSIQDFSGILELSQKQGWKLVMLDLDLDTSAPQGEMMAHIFASFAQFERRLIGQRTKEGMAVVRARGPAAGKKLIGRPRLVKGRLEKRIKVLYSGGMSYRGVATALNVESVPSPRGIGPWRWQTVARVVARAGSNSIRD
jgi:DNA invertase Pin-like site-specific DNA recombinase